MRTSWSCSRHTVQLSMSRGKPSTKQIVFPSGCKAFCRRPTVTCSRQHTICMRDPRYERMFRKGYKISGNTSWVCSRRPTFKGDLSVVTSCRPAHEAEAWSITRLIHCLRLVMHIAVRWVCAHFYSTLMPSFYAIATIWITFNTEKAKHSLPMNRCLHQH